MSFRVVTQAKSPAPWRADVLGLTPDEAGDCGCGSGAQRLLRYRDGVFENAMAQGLTSDSGVTAICRAQDGPCSFRRGRQRRPASTRGKFETLAPDNALPPTPVMSMAETANGELWLGTRDAGLFR